MRDDGQLTLDVHLLFIPFIWAEIMNLRIVSIPTVQVIRA
jgi:hypothetical protein